MSKLSKQRARARKAKYAKPSLPRPIGANDNHPSAVNDNAAPVSIRGIRLTEKQAERFADAQGRISSKDLGVQRSGHLMLEALDREIDRLVGSNEVTARFKEMADLEQVREVFLEDVTVKASDGTSAKTKRVHRDGLETLLTANSISRTQHSAGLRYRADYELLDPENGLTPPALDQTRNIVRGGDGFAQKRREREEFVRDLEAMIQDEDPTFRGALGRADVERIGRAVWALREIAGKGSTLMALSPSGSVQKRTSDALLTALDCAAIAYGLE
uniref:Uncharacterized protein n=1 Tax=viral metagenome TaxID=1070528 RepID=A0A6H1ZBE2_9ZZZZ